MSNLQASNIKRFDRYRIAIAAAGMAVTGFSVIHFPLDRVDLRLLFFTAITMLVSSRISVQIPRVNANVTVADSFIFLTLLLYGPEAAILLAASDGLVSAQRISKRPLTLIFNSAMMACSTLITAVVINGFFGSVTELASQDLLSFVSGLAALALLQYFANTGMSAIGLSLKEERPLVNT